MTGNEANVRSIETLETFRASMIVFLTKARRSIDQVGEEVQRTRNWLDQDQKLHWQTELKKRTRAMEQAQQELVTARYSTLRASTTMQEVAVRKAKAAVQEADEKLRRVKGWIRSFDSSVDPLLKKVESLRSYLEHDIPKAIATLSQTQRALAAYTDNASLMDGPKTPSSSESESGAEATVEPQP